VGKLCAGWVTPTWLWTVKFWTGCVLVACKGLILVMGWLNPWVLSSCYLRTSANRLGGGITEVTDVSATLVYGFASIIFTYLLSETKGADCIFTFLF